METSQCLKMAAHLGVQAQEIDFSFLDFDDILTEYGVDIPGAMTEYWRHTSSGTYLQVEWERYAILNVHSISREDIPSHIAIDE